MRARNIIIAAKVLSVVFTPFHLPIVGLAGLLTLTYLSMLPWPYKVYLLLLFYVFTILLPMALIRIYRHYQGWTLIELGSRERRAIPYIISMLSYMLCCYVMDLTHVPHFLRSVLIAALVIQVACSAVNLFIKISTHTAAGGGVAGALAAFSFIFSFNPVWWLCAVLLLSGVVGTCRMILRQHSLHEIVAGFIVGFLCAFCSVLLY